MREQVKEPKQNSQNRLKSPRLKLFETHITYTQLLILLYAFQLDQYLQMTTVEHSMVNLVKM